MREIYYHKRDSQGKPRITICLLKEETAERVISKGVSICSFRDNPVKSIGRERAKKRAYAAISAERNLFPISRIDALVVTDECLRVEDMDVYFKGVYNPTLTDHEKFIVSKTNRKI